MTPTSDIPVSASCAAHSCSFRDLVCLSESELAQYDIAEINLACAVGLPGAEMLDVESCLHTLDEWAEKVRWQTLKQIHLFERWPDRFHHSPSFFRVVALVTVLQRDLGLRYNPALMCDPSEPERDDGFFTSAANLFLHGIIEGKGGTCSSLPPLYVAIGRRLGYPLRLVRTNGHLFARWDDPATPERFNIECTSLGMVSHPDAYYLQWPFTMTAEQARRNGYLRSLTRQEELALFLGTRGACLQANWRMREAVEAHAWAASLAPQYREEAVFLERAVDRWHGLLRQVLPPDQPPITVRHAGRRFPVLPLPVEQEIVALQLLEEQVASRSADPCYCPALYRKVHEWSALPGRPGGGYWGFVRSGLAKDRYPHLLS